jgi:site-specific DNA-cytosine methylase
MCNGMYKVSWHILNTKDYGIPQSRPRVYIVGYQTRVAFSWPTPFASPPELARILDDDVEGACMRDKRFVASLTPAARHRVKQLLHAVRAKGGDPRSPCTPYVFDIDGSKPYFTKGYSPCITRARGGSGFYLPSRGRRMTLGERLRLQGLTRMYLHPKHRKGISDRQLGLMIGNAMSGNVLHHLVLEMLRVTRFIAIKE